MVQESRSAESLAMKGASWVLASGGRFARAGGLAAAATGVLGRLRPVRRHGGRRNLGRLPGPGAAWSDARDVPAPAEETFRSWWQRTDGGKDGS